MKYKLEGGFITYDQVGNGIPLLFIHGYPLSRKIWLDQIESLSTKASLISVDLRGHGESYPFEGPYPMDLLAEDCKRLLDDININYPILVCGLSMGGYVTFSLYQKYPEIFKGMILTSTRSSADTIEGKANRDAAIRNVNDHGVPFIAESLLPKLVSPITFSSKPDLVNTITTIMLETSIQGIIGASQGMRDRRDSTSLLAQISCPVLLIHGEDDQIISIKETETMHNQIPNSKLVVVPKAGHLLNMEQPGQFNQALLEFISSVH